MGPRQLILMLGAWQALIWATDLPPFLLPSPLRVAMALWFARTEIATNAMITAQEVLSGYFIGCALGITLAIAMASSVRLCNSLRPMLMVSQTIPIFALAPILTLWLGYGMAPKIAMTVMIVFFPVASALLDGLLRTPPEYLELVKTMGAGPSRTMISVRIPAAWPALGTGLRMAAVYAPVGAVIGEWVGGSLGLGAMMIHANGRMKIDQVFAALFVLAAMTLAFHAIISAMTRIRRSA